ncbi:hypothetical protein RCL_jg27832.t2 [Rhizophagus clarus]|uniref:Uncharacterized protein n=1 Tax=Rhizophagus clarus TaxID=94130 RepID=A0A8H3LA10_9GLOM|nr:hypothetical protein RCL_jg27832.t2 [Rhizophagus clarus]
MKNGLIKENLQAMTVMCCIQKHVESTGLSKPDFKSSWIPLNAEFVSSKFFDIWEFNGDVWEILRGCYSLSTCSRFFGSQEVGDRFLKFPWMWISVKVELFGSRFILFNENGHLEFSIILLNFGPVPILKHQDIS